ncbi:MAG TPA: hypothetical protein VII78_20535 [Myxococcota bacterium]|jgi:hypothetical protein
MSHGILRFALALLLLAPALAADAQLSVSGSSWSGTAQLKAKLRAPGQGTDKMSGSTSYQVSFGPLAAPTLAANAFRLVLDDGSVTLDFTGTYTLDGNGRPVLTPDSAAFDAALRSLIDDVCMQEIGDPAQCGVFATLDLSIGRHALSAKPRRGKRGVDSLKSAGTVSFTFSQGASKILSVQLQFKSRGVTRD